MLYDRKSLGRIFESMEQMRDRTGDAIDTASQGVPLGFKSLNDEQFKQLVLQQVLAQPPVVITDPATGASYEANPWLAMLPHCENGAEIMRRIERVLGVNGVR